MIETGEQKILEFETGSVIAERYEVVSRLGAGGMGAVFKVIDRALDNEHCAIKLLYPHLVKDAVVFARFRNEVLVARQLAHPNIVRLYDFGNAGMGYYFISMEYIKGASLGQKIYGPRHERPDFKETLRILLEVCYGVKHAHDKKVIHRDLKPDNVLITPDGDIKITDFGLARTLYLDKGFTATGEAVGTPYYMAPEQIRGDEVDGRCDIYAIGIMAYEMVVGAKPFDADCWFNLAALHLLEPLPDFVSSENGIPRWFQEFAKKCAAKNREDRFNTIDEVIEVLEEKSEKPFANTRRMPALFGLYNPSRAKKHLSPKQAYRRKLKKLAMGVGLISAISAVVFVNEDVRGWLTKWVLKTESSTTADLSAVKSILGTEVKLSPKDFFKHIQSGDSEELSLLIKSGMSPNLKDESGVPALLAAIDSGSLPSVRVLVEAGAELNFVEGGMNPLLVAISGKNPQIAQYLIEKGANVNPRAKDGSTALMLAVKSGEVETIEALLKAQAYVNVQNTEGRTALHYAVQGGNLGVLQMLLDKAAQVNSQDRAGISPLMAAAQSDKPELVQALLLAGADKSLKNTQGDTALDMGGRQVRPLLKENTVIVVNPPVEASEEETFATASAPGTTASEKAAVMTRLRLKGKPLGQWQRGRVVTLTGIQVTVVNVGEVTAEEVKVRAMIPGGKPVQLKGPTELPRKGEGTYTLQLTQIVSQAGELKAEASCKNCRGQ